MRLLAAWWDASSTSLSDPNESWRGRSLGAWPHEHHQKGDGEHLHPVGKERWRLGTKWQWPACPASRVADDETWRGGAHRSGRGHQSCSSGRWWRISHARQIVSTVRCRHGWSGRRSCICPLFRRCLHEHYERVESRTPPNAVDLPVPLCVSFAAAPYCRPGGWGDLRDFIVRRKVPVRNGVVRILPSYFTWT